MSDRLLPIWQPTWLGHSFVSDHPLPAEEAVRRLWPHLGALGITRLARQTGLDRLGIPVWAAFRPNSKSLAGAQGKGLTDAAACASAAMEAAEVAVAERPSGETCQATAAELTREGQAWFDPQRFLPFNASFDVTTPIKWIRAEDLDTGKPIWLPVDVVDMDGERSDIPNISKSSNGLASGNTLEDARFHALCELIERDGTTLWSLLPEDARRSTCFDARGLDCVAVDEIVTRISYAGFRINLFNQQSDVGIPVVMAVLGPADDNGHVGQLEITAGYGAHPDAGQAALRAITEAAQSRVTAIAASRDDIHSASFRNAADASSLALLTALPDGRAPFSQSNALEAGMLVDRLTAAGCAVCAVTISPPDASFFAVRIVSPDLEDRGANLNWRPGWRSFDALERLP